jgi:uncharacterized protein (DUF2336 family)
LAAAFQVPSSVEPGQALDLLDLARSRAPGDRERLLLGLTSLCRASPDAAASQGTLLSDVFVALVQQAERDIRRELARELASADWAPVALVNMLALDEIDIARPLIASSPLLGEEQLLEVLITATLEHQIEIARRPSISGRIADVIIEDDEPAVMTALASNPTAEISEAGLARLVEKSRRVAALRAPLVRHPRLSTDLAGELYGWVGAALRQAIGERFSVDADRIGAAIDAATREALAPPVEAPAPTAAQREEMDRRLVQKLQQSGQLRPGYAIRALRDQNLSMFEHAIAALAGVTLAQVRSAVRADTLEPLTLACTAAGVDRAVLPALLEALRPLTAGYPAGSLPPAPCFLSSPEQARRRLKMAFGHSQRV